MSSYRLYFISEHYLKYLVINWDEKMEGAGGGGGGGGDDATNTGNGT